MRRDSPMCSPTSPRYLACLISGMCCRLMRKATVKVQDMQWRETWQERGRLWSIFNTDKGDFLVWQFSQHKHKSPAHCLEPAMEAVAVVELWLKHSCFFEISKTPHHTCSSRFPPGQMSGSVWPPPVTAQSCSMNHATTLKLPTQTQLVV